MYRVVIDSRRSVSTVLETSDIQKAEARFRWECNYALTSGCIVELWNGGTLHDFLDR